MNENIQHANSWGNRQTGYPSIDKPWLKYYSEEARSAKLPEGTIYEYLRRDNIDGLHRTALRYVNRQITYGELFDKIDIAASAWASAGIKQGDIVSGITPSLPELIYSFYGLNKIGAVCDFFDSRTAPTTVLNELQLTGAKALILFDEFAERFAEVIQQSGIKLIVLLSAGDSLAGLPKLLLKLKKKRISVKGISYSEFVGRRNQDLKVNAVKNSTHIPALMEHTGGTTGTPKAVVLSNQNVNAVVHQYRKGKQLLHDDRWLLIGFPFVAYTIICSMHIPLSAGMVCVMCFTTDSDKMETMIFREKINHIAYTPAFWEHTLRSKKTQSRSLSFLVNPIVGADMLDKAKEQEINDFLHSHGCKSNICKGYGMTEVGSAVSVCISNESNKIGSVGIPFVNMDIAIFEIGSDRELPYGEQGEICISGPSVMLGYFNNQEATDEVKRQHSDGRIWLHSGDLGHMDEDGFLFIDGRLKRMIIDHVGFKIFAPQVEQVLSEISCVEKCCVVGAPDREYNNGQIAVAYILLKKERIRMGIICERKAPGSYRSTACRQSLSLWKHSRIHQRGRWIIGSWKGW